MHITPRTDRIAKDAQVAGTLRSPFIGLPTPSHFPKELKIHELLAAAPPERAWTQLIANNRKIEDGAYDFGQNPTSLWSTQSPTTEIALNRPAQTHTWIGNYLPGPSGRGAAARESAVSQIDRRRGVGSR